MRITIPALTASLLISTAAFAETEARSAIDALPDQGVVTLSGTIESVTDEDTFILRDQAGNTIDIHTASITPVNPGDNVTVRGEKTDEMAGMGEEIRSATLVDYDKPMAKSTAVSPLGDAPHVAHNQELDTPNITVREGVSREVTSIAALPKEGQVELTGVVASIDNKQEFTLKDATGETINVQSASTLDLREGDEVTVSGLLDDRFLGFGRQIERADVLVVGSN